MTNRVSSAIWNELRKEWSHLVTTVPRLVGRAVVHPQLFHEVMVARDVAENHDPTTVGFELRPVVFRVPAKRKTSGNMFIVVRGYLSFVRSDYEEHRKLVTNSFSTEVGYFVHDNGELQHRFGAHYDFDPERLGHPAFHVQMGSFSDFGTEVTTAYGVEAPVRDFMSDILARVRVPSAQMDVFSVFVQICADLINEHSSAEACQAFDELVARGTFCSGAAWRVKSLTPEAGRCYRSRHWYPMRPGAQVES